MLFERFLKNLKKVSVGVFPSKIDFWLFLGYPNGVVLKRGTAQVDRMPETTVTIVRTFVCSTYLVVL